MSDPTKDVSESEHGTKLPRRDWLLLPLLSLSTVVLLAGSVELIARRVFPQSRSMAEDCMVFTDPSTGPRGIPNSVCWEKIPEGELTENHFNSCGHRTDAECRSKSIDVYRIVMIGTSMTMGMRVPREKTFAALLPLELSRETGNKIEVYNEALPYRTPEVWADHFDEVLEARPDMVLWAMHPNDLQLSNAPLAWIPRELNLWQHIKARFAARSFSQTIEYAFHHTRTSVLLLDALYRDPRRLVKSSLMEPDSLIGYLKDDPSPQWQQRLKVFDEAVAKIEMRTKSAGVPLVVVMLPTHVQANMVTLGEWPEGIDPYKIDRELKSIVTSHGATYIDILPDIRNEPDIQKGFYALDVHPNPLGHAILSGAIAKELTSGPLPALNLATISKSVMEARQQP
jgi:hypothetical protein